METVHHDRKVFIVFLRSEQLFGVARVVRGERDEGRVVLPVVLVAEQIVLYDLVTEVVQVAKDVKFLAGLSLIEAVTL